MCEKEVVDNLFSIVEDPSGTDYFLLPQALKVLDKTLKKSQDKHSVIAFFALSHNGVSKLISSVSRFSSIPTNYLSEAYEGS
mmetsp:Transcript_7155/g.11300  ORF Transcript_7155/g.11300 Transcript_7155/m.11300 type:complete len:82 (-) Transcript_7155:1419-1664(-)